MENREELLLKLIAASEEPSIESIAKKLDMAGVDVSIFLEVFDIVISETIKGL